MTTILRAFALGLTCALGAGAGCGSTYAVEPTDASALPKILTDPETRAAVYLPDFSYAGYRFGLETPGIARGTVIDVVAHGALPDDDIDDSAGLRAAIAAAHGVDGPVIVRLSPGRFILTEMLTIERSDFVLQGAGRGDGGTDIHMPRPLRLVDTGDRFDAIRQYLVDLDKRQRDPRTNLDVIFSEYSWTGGFIWVKLPDGFGQPDLADEAPAPPRGRAKEAPRIVSGRRGETTILAPPDHGFRAGDIVRVDWFNRDGQDGALLRAIYGPDTSMVGAHHWRTPNRPLVRQSTRVLAVAEGGRITLGDLLLHDIGPDLEAQLTPWAPLTEVGIEDLALTFPNAPNYGHHTEEGFNAIQIAGVFDGWVRNVTFENADSGLLTYDSASLSILDVESKGERRAHYAVHLGNVHNILVDDLRIFNRVIHPLTFNTRSTRSVYRGAEVFSAPVLDQHAGSNHQNLFDNVVLHLTTRPGPEGPRYPVFDGSGAPYWQPGHGAFNTTWNLEIIVEGGAAPGDTVSVDALDEGPFARIIGLHGNRPLTLDYRPAPYVDRLNSEIAAAPSLYRWQLAERRTRIAAGAE